MLQPLMEDLFLARPENPAEVGLAAATAPPFPLVPTVQTACGVWGRACAWQYIIQYLGGTSTDGAKRMDALQSEITLLKAQLGGAAVAAPGVASAPALAPPVDPASAAPAPAPAVTETTAATGILADGNTYVIEGTEEAAAADLDFDLVMDKDLAANVYPAAKLDAARAAEHTALCAQFCTPEVWEKYKDMSSTGPAKWSIARAINSGVMYPSSFVGCHAGDKESYDDFKDFFYPVIQAYHKGFDIETTKHVTDMDPSKITHTLLDTAQSKIISTRIRVARNLSMFPLNPGAGPDSRGKICDMMEKVYAAIDPENDLSGDMFRHTTMSDEQRQGLIDDHFLFRGKDKMQAASGYHRYWPEGRGVFHNKAKTFVNWLNEGDHLRIISMEQGGDVLGVFTRLAEGAKMIKAGVEAETSVEEAFMMHPIFGSLTCCPSNIGTGMRGSVHILVPKLIRTIGFDAIDKMCRERNCQARGSSGEHSAVVDRIDVSNWRRIGFPEYSLVDDMIQCANFLAEEEDKVLDDVLAEPAAETAGEAAAAPAAEPAAATGGVGDKIAALLAANPDNICLNTFDVEYYNSLGDLKPAFLKCLASGIENPDSGMGCYACQPEDYDRFKPFFSKALAKYHKVAEDAQHVNNWSLEGVEGLPEGGVLDISKLGLPELSMRVRVGRNLKAFPLPGAMTQEDRCNLENRMIEAFEVLFKDPAYGGKYCSFTPGHANFVDEAEYQALVDAHIAFKDMSADPYLLSAGIAQHWPYGRGVYISEDKGFIIWVGEEDHLRIMCMKKGTILNEVFDRLKGALDVVNGIESIGGFAMSEDYGVVTSCPTNLGTGMRASLHIQLPNLTSDGTDAKAKAIAKPLGLSVRGLGGEHTPIGADGTVDISPSARFCITEAQIITALYKGIELLKKAEDEAVAAAPAAEAVAEPEAEPEA
jgi:protein-arginine kinase